MLRIRYGTRDMSMLATFSRRATHTRTHARATYARKPPTTPRYTPPLLSLDVHAFRSVALLLVERALLSLLEVNLRHLHAALAQREEASLGADGLDVRARELVLGHDHDLEVDIVGEAHARRVDAKDAALGLGVGQRELDLAVDAARADERRVKALDGVCGHDDLDVAALVEAIELVEELEHGTLDLARAAGVGVVALGTDGVNLVDEDDGGRVLVGHAEELSHELGAVAEVLLD
mmetsp:Transcript_25251/g.79226  ORF Transcript_25251/g.79226 Transcript_25251/m.79226 type:complete len:235 (+) Transcript_25251:651-1355(+)